jgi:hypothetical protein
MNHHAQRTLFVSIALATILAGGITLVWLFVYAWTGSVVAQLLLPQEPGEQLVFTQDGEPLVQSSSWYPHQATTYRTLDGQPVENLDKLELHNRDGWLPTPDLQLREWSGWYTRIKGFAEPSGVPHFWYLLNDGRPLARAYFKGYDAKTKREIGYFGTAGFRSEVPPLDEQFEIETKLIHTGLTAGQWGQVGQEPYSGQNQEIRAIFLISGGSLFKVDLRHRSVAKVPLEQSVLSVGNVDELNLVPNEPRAIEKARIGVRLADRVLLLDEAGHEVRSIRLPEQARSRNLMVQLTTTGEAIVVAQQDRHHDLTEINWLDQQGDIARHAEISLRWGWYGDGEPARKIAMAVPSPLVLAINFALTRPRQNVQNGNYPDFSTAVAASLAEAWPTYLLVSALAALLAVVGYRWHARYHHPRAVAWAAFVFLGGPAALVGYWLCGRWPATERCLHCGATVPRDRESCPLCASEFPLAVRKGTEIFA